MAFECKQMSIHCFLLETHGRIHHWGKWGNFPHQDYEPRDLGEIYLRFLLGNFPSKKPDADPLKLDVDFFLKHKMWPLPKNSGPNPQTFQFLVGVPWVPTLKTPLIRACFPQ